MGFNKSLEVSNEAILYLQLVRDVFNDTRMRLNNVKSLRLTLDKVSARLAAEGIGFLTKTLPRLGKGLDRALSSQTPFDSASLGFKPKAGSKLPKLFGELFERVFDKTGAVLQTPCVCSVRHLRQLLYCFYKYKLPYTHDEEQNVVSAFKNAEDDLTGRIAHTENIGRAVRDRDRYCYQIPEEGHDEVTVAQRARVLLAELFRDFDPTVIHPRHGPGAVATRQRLETKYRWTNVSSRITECYPFDAYFLASLGHVCDTYKDFGLVGDADLPARVILVPKDSRGPRLISCEPVDFQWVQQGLGQAIVKLVESHPLTRWNVNFTHQCYNQFGALLGSSTGKYATLDLKEASDRVSLSVVRLLFPGTVLPYLEACRSLCTTLPDGEVVKLEKFAPMGSCLCFPILALTIWALLSAAAPDLYTRERILVYGDDVIVPTAYAEDAMKHLESFGLKINRDKSCTSGLFRESCGQDAFAGESVTPVRLRTVWSTSRSADVYTSWISYANSFYDKRYVGTASLISDWLKAIYGPIPGKDMGLNCPSLCPGISSDRDEFRKRWHSDYQKWQYRVLDVKSPSISRVSDGWSKLLRYFAETTTDSPNTPYQHDTNGLPPSFEGIEPFSVSLYTQRDRSMLRFRWRG